MEKRETWGLQLGCCWIFETRHHDADEIEAELDKRLGSALEFKIDQISSFINAARITTNIAERSL